MKRIFKKIIIGKLIYKLGYELIGNEIEPRLEICERKYLLGFCCFYKDFMFYINNNYGYNAILVDTMEEMFIELRKKINIPENVEKEFESLYLLCKLNDFKKL